MRKLIFLIISLPLFSYSQKTDVLARASMRYVKGISLGFLVLCFSNFVPTIIFGLFTSLAMIFAMIGVLITLPSILKYQK